MNKEQIKIENKNQLPDVASDSTQLVAMGELEWVGMEEISVPVLLHDSEGASCRVPAKVSVYVNLIDPKAKGIHMSRLYKTIQEKFILGEISLLTRGVPKPIAGKGSSLTIMSRKMVF